MIQKKITHLYTLRKYDDLLIVVQYFLSDQCSKDNSSQKAILDLINFHMEVSGNGLWDYVLSNSFKNFKDLCASLNLIGDASTVEYIKNIWNRRDVFNEQDGSLIDSALMFEYEDLFDFDDENFEACEDHFLKSVSNYIVNNLDCLKFNDPNEEQWKAFLHLHEWIFTESKLNRPN